MNPALPDGNETTASEKHNVAVEKSVGPVNVLVFLGLEIDSNDMVIRVPQNKIIELVDIIQLFLLKVKVTLRELQALAVKLNFNFKAIRSSRAFIRRIYDAMLGLTKPYHHRRVSLELS